MKYKEKNIPNLGEKPCSLRPHIYSIISLQSIQGTMPKSAEVLIWEILFVEEESLCGCLPSSPRTLSPCWICHSLSNPHHSQQLLIKAAKVEFCARHSVLPSMEDVLVSPFFSALSTKSLKPFALSLFLSSGLEGPAL